MTTFHEWLLNRAGDDSPVGDLARDYALAVSRGVHGTANSPDELRGLVATITEPDDLVTAALDQAEAEWFHPTNRDTRND